MGVGFGLRGVLYLSQRLWCGGSRLGGLGGGGTCEWMGLVL